MLEKIGDACTGCSACANVCPKQAITMLPDSDGFLFPKIDSGICVGCGICEKTCPILNPIELNTENIITAYAVQNKDEKIRLDSTSGGAFSAIAQYVLDRNGVVFGAMFDENFDVVHDFVEKTEDLWKLRRSKYVQSRIGYAFKNAKSFLDTGRWVCFSGTPCQIGGLRNVLRKDYEHLILVDIICHSVPSPKMWTCYKESQEKKYNAKIQDVRFREKTYGFSNPTLTICFESGKTYSQGSIDPYLGAFTGGMSRKSCAQCAFKKKNRLSDFTIYDCWSIGKFNSAMDDNKGTNGVLINSGKACDVFSCIKEKFKVQNLNLEETLNGDGEKATKKIKLNPKRDAFFEDLGKVNFYELKRKYYPANILDVVVSSVKPLIYKTGLLKKLNDIKKALKK